MRTHRYAYKRFRFLLIVLIAGLGSFQLGISPVFSGAMIVPAQSAGPYRIGGAMPSNRAELNQDGINLGGDEQIDRIEVTSTLYVLEGSWLRVHQHGKQDVLRFYGYPDDESTPQRLLYPYNGLEFEIDPETEAIEKITIHIPKVRIYQINPDAIQTYKQYYKK